MNVLDAMRQMNQRVMEEVGRQFGADGVEIDAHFLCAPDHLPYQGGQYTNEEFREIQDSLDRPFGEWNCRHTWSPILMGVSPPAYSPEQLEQFERYSTEPVEVDGVTRTRYEWSQRMRRMETDIRRCKDTATLARYAGDGALRRECQGRVNALTREYERLSERAGLGPEFRRTYVAGFRDAKDEAAMARGYAIGQWPAAGGKISPEAYDDLKSFARENGIKLHGFEAFKGDTELIREFIAEMRSTVTKMNADHLFAHKGLHLMTDYTMVPEDYAITHNTTITINPAAFRDREALKNDYAERANVGWFVNGTDYHSIARHEMGHAIIHALGLSPRQISEIVSGIDGIAISEYASTTDGETIAESFSANLSGVDSKPSLTVIERCVNIINSRR